MQHGIVFSDKLFNLCHLLFVWSKYSFHLSVAQFPHLQNGDNITFLTITELGLSVIRDRSTYDQNLNIRNEIVYQSIVWKEFQVHELIQENYS